MNFWTFADAHPWPAVALAGVIMFGAVTVAVQVREAVVVYAASRRKGEP